jgi:uncharacterized iron-regulated membrane protein
MRRLVLNIHRFVALAAVLFIVILAVTGSIMAFEPELDRLAHPKLSYISPGQQPLSLDKIGHNVSHAFGGEPIVAFLPSLSPTISLQVVLPSGIAYVNQYTGEVLGLRVRGQTFLGYVRAIHVRLGGGDSGKEIVKWSSMAMLLSLASGLYLWWPMKQMQIRRTSGSKRFCFDLHDVFGIYALLPMVLLAASGVGLGFEDQLKPLLFKLTHSTATEAARKLPRTWQETGTEITPDQAVALAQGYMPGALPYRIQMPAYGGFYQVSLSDPRDRIAGRRKPSCFGSVSRNTGFAKPVH